MMKYFLLIMGFCLGLVACQSSNSGSTSAPKKESQATAPTSEGQLLYPSIPAATVHQLFRECDFLDVIFNGSFRGVSMSLSQDQQKDIRQTLSFITTTPASINTNCATTGRMFFLKKGETLLEADFYLQDNCTYFIFYENKKPSYANQMSQQGANYFMKMIQTAGQARGQ